MPGEVALRKLVAEFTEEFHAVSVADGEWLPMYDEDGRTLDGIRGRSGAFGPVTVEDGGGVVELGADLIEMAYGAEFPTHVHPGGHILYGVRGNGWVTISGQDGVPLRAGDTVFIHADQPHGVKGPQSAEWRDCPLMFLAVGVPHKHVSSDERMHLLTEEEASAYREKLDRAPGFDA